jgi:hypothetical protein
VATPFERRLYTTELQLAQRYYQNFMASGVGSRDASNTNGSLYTPFQFLVQMRAAPTCDSTLNEGSADGESQGRFYPGQTGWSFERITNSSAIFRALLPGGVGNTANVPWRCQFLVKASSEL